MNLLLSICTCVCAFVRVCVHNTSMPLTPEETQLLLHQRGPQICVCVRVCSLYVCVRTFICRCAYTHLHCYVYFKAFHCILRHLCPCGFVFVLNLSFSTHSVRA